MKTGTWRKPVALACIAALVVAACGDDDDGAGSTAAPTTAGATATTAGGETTVAGTDETTATSTEETTAGSGRRLVERRRQRRVRTDRRGVPGPQRLHARSGRVPRGLGSQAGHHRHQINVLHQPPEVRPVRRLRPHRRRHRELLQVHQRARVASTARKLVLDVKDDGYQPDKTKTNVDEALGVEQVRRASSACSARRTTSPSGTTTNDECMPQLFNATGRAAVG